MLGVLRCAYGLPAVCRPPLPSTYSLPAGIFQSRIVRGLAAPLLSAGATATLVGPRAWERT